MRTLMHTLMFSAALLALSSAAMAAGEDTTQVYFSNLGVRAISVINPPWKPGGASRTLVFLTIPVDSQ